MPETSDNWPAPAYRVPSAKYLHALGVISLNYNTFEHYLFAIFDPETLKAIEHLMEHFNWCFTTRNLVLHAHRSAYEIEFELTEAEPNEAKLSLAKPKKGSLTQLNFMYLSLEHLRANADSMHEGYLYLLNLWAYMALFEGADVSRSTIQSELAGLVINQNAMRLLRAFSKINRTSSQRALVTLAEHIAGEH